MTSATNSPSASSVITRNFEYAQDGITLRTDSGTELCKVFQYGDYVAIERVPERHTAIDALVSGWAADPTRRAALEEARRWLADEFHHDDGVTIRTLRLRKGLSQQQLAGAIGTSQPHVARIESGANSLNIETCRRLAEALEVDLNSLNLALLRQEQIVASRLSASGLQQEQIVASKLSASYE